MLENKVGGVPQTTLEKVDQGDDLLAVTAIIQAAITFNLSPDELRSFIGELSIEEAEEFMGKVGGGEGAGGLLKAAGEKLEPL